jgi:hypothetical protein
MVISSEALTGAFSRILPLRANSSSEMLAPKKKKYKNQAAEIAHIQPHPGRFKA